MDVHKSLFQAVVMLFFLFSVAVKVTGQTPDRGDTRLVIISDLNESYGSTHYDEYVDSALVWIEKWNPDLILTGGDHVAGQSLDLDEETLWAMWEAFDDTIAQPIYDLGIPLGVTMGNHDASGSGSFDHERKIAHEYFQSAPNHLSFHNRNNIPFYYSFTCNDLFVISWDASAHEIPIKEREWIKEQLNSNAAQKASYRILIGHLPLYAVAQGRNRYGEILKDTDELFSLLKENGLDIYVSGHHHAYYPAEKDGILLLSAGAIGGGPRQLLGSDEPARRTITLLDFLDDAGDFQITTFDLENNMKEISLDELPKSIEGKNGTIYRYNP